MSKRHLSFLAALLLLLTTVFAGFALGEGNVAYVNPANGKGLNLRPTPSKDREAILTIPFGGKVYIDNGFVGSDTWVAVTYNNTYGFVMSRYLTSYKPEKRPTPANTPKPSTTSISQIFAGFTFSNYTVAVRPSSPGAPVHMRWAPTKASSPIRDFHQNDILTVISQNDEWAQVVDPNSGITGFMMRAFLTDNAYGIITSDGNES